LATAIDLPDGSSPCSCGMTHSVAIEEIVLGPDAFRRLVAYCAQQGWRRVLLVTDANTERAAGREVAAALGDAGVEAAGLSFPQKAGLIADRAAVSAVEERLGSEPVDVAVAVGSGVITDVVRYTSDRGDADFISVPTAASMDGYASGVAAMEFDGVKQTYPARPPVAIFADPAVLVAAPAELTRSGLGDMLGKATARVDWLAAHLLYGEDFCPDVDERVAGPFERALELAEAVLAGAADAIEAVMRGLLESGVAMAMIGSSRPASGTEHHASHFWDLLAARGIRDHAPHGLQVAYATRFAMRLQRFAYGGGAGALRAAAQDPVADTGAAEWLGSPLPDEVEKAIEGKREYLASRAPRWPDAGGWEEARGRLAGALAPFDAVDRALDAAAIPAGPGYLGIDARTLQATFRYARLLRARYTVTDFLAGQGVLDAALDETLGAATSDPARGAG
jgi:glycerol-1-phosphate dehydrogenase [NAD(P)+]